MSTAAPVTAKQDTTGWITEWTRDPTPCHDACAEALPMFSLDVVGVVVKLLRKHDLFGLAEQEEAYGKTRFEAQVGIVGELPLPANIDAILQTDLSTLLSERARACWAGKLKVTDVFSLYFKPAYFSPKKALELAGIACDSTDQWLRVADKKACWILFPDECTGLNTIFSAAEVGSGYVPKGFEASRTSTAVFCITTKFACTRTRIYADKPLRCFTTYNTYDLLSFGERGFAVKKYQEIERMRGEQQMRVDQESSIRDPAKNSKEGIAPVMIFEGSAPIKI